MSLRKGSITADVYVTMEPDRRGNYVCDGTSDNTEFQNAIDDLRNDLGGGTIYIGPGHYTTNTYTELYDDINIMGAGYKTWIEIADTRPDVVPSDWVHQCVWWNNNRALYNVNLSDMRIDGNKANNTRSSFTHSFAPVYIGHSGSNVNCYRLYVHDGLNYGIFYDAISGNMYDQEVMNCRVFGNGFNDISFQTSSYVFRDSRANNNTVGGDTGDIGLDAETYSGGNLYRIQFNNNTVLEMTGLGGSALKAWFAIRFERNTLGCEAVGNTIYRTNKGIGIHSGSSGGHVISGNVITLHNTETANRGINCEKDDCIISGNKIIGNTLSGDWGIRVENADDCNVYGNHIEGVEVGVQMVTSDDVIINGNRIFATTPITGSGNRPQITNNNWQGSTNDTALGGFTNPRYAINVDRNGAWWASVSGAGTNVW